MDSFFASVEQHRHPHLRGRPVGVVPLLAESTCCIAASYEAKAFGVKTGTRVADARVMCPGIEIIHADPPEYVRIHNEIVDVVESCIHVDHVLSIDEMVCWLPLNWRTKEKVTEVAHQIKRRLEEHFSSAIKCSIGVAPNGWLAKVASKMKKPDGFLIVNHADLPHCLYDLELLDLHGVGENMELRLHAKGIHTLEQLCHTPKQVLRAIWNGVEGERMWHKLRGDVIEDLDKDPTKKSMSHGHVLPPDLRSPQKAITVIHRLMQKVALRARVHGLFVGALELNLRYTDRAVWSQSMSFPETSDSLFLTKAISSLWKLRPYEHAHIHKADIVLHRLVSSENFTPSLFERGSSEKQLNLNQAMDQITSKFGKQALYLGGAHGAMDSVKPKIAFNHIPDVDVEA